MDDLAPSLLSLAGIAVGYGGRAVITDMNVTFPAGAYAIVGGNGCGKTTLLKALAGILELMSGRILIGGKDLHRDRVLARSQLSYVPADSIAYPYMTGLEYLQLVASAKKVAFDAELHQTCESLALGGVLPLRFSAMSTGMRKKVFLASTVIGKPRVMLMDEPSNALDADARQALVGMIERRRSDAAILVASHDTELIQRMQASIFPLPLHPKHAPSASRQ